MTVPVWAAIPDSMVAPEAPVSSDLMTRLRNQYAAFLGVDPTAVSQPPFALPASVAKVTSSDCFYAVGTLGTARTTSDMVVSNVADDNEDIQIQAYTPQTGVGIFGGAGLAGNIFMYTTEGGAQGPFVYTIQGIEVIYAALSATDIKFYITATNGSTSTVTIPIDNAYHNIIVRTFSNDFEYLLGKAHVTSGQVFLQLKIDAHSSGLPGSYQGCIAIPFALKSFQSKV